jgi:hypothetical protein
MNSTLLDVPRCLNLDACFVGAPRPVAPKRNSWMRAPEPAENGTEVFRRRATQECLDTVAVLRAYREPLPGETWLLPAGSERRLLAQVNAILALGSNAVHQVASVAIDNDLPEPGRVFAALFVLGCVEGGAWLPNIRDTFVKAVTRHAAEAAAAVEALSLAPNPLLPTCIEPLLSDERPRLRAAALRVMAYRGEVTEAVWQAAMRDTDTVVLAAATAVPLGAYDPEACDQALRALLEHDNEIIVRNALRAGLGIRSQSAYSRCLALVDSRPGWADAARCLAMFGFISDAQRIRTLLQGVHWLHGVHAAAVLGSVTLVPDLLNALERIDLTPQQSTEVKSALIAITGLPFGKASDATEARQLWERESTGFRADARYRIGLSLDLPYLLQALSAPNGARNARQDTYLEMQAVTDSRLPRFNAYDFVGNQLASLRRIEQWLARPAGMPPTSQQLH